jgi:chlorophyll synthase
MTLNDFKAIKGDSEMGIRSLPVSLGAQRAAQVACAIMLAPQFVVIALLLSWGRFVPAAIVVALVTGQGLMMRKFLREPIAKAYWYSGFGVPLFVSGMMASAVAVRGLG